MNVSELTITLKPDTALLDTALDRLGFRIAELKAEALTIKGMSAEIDNAVDEVIFGLERMVNLPSLSDGHE